MDVNSISNVTQAYSADAAKKAASEKTDVAKETATKKSNFSNTAAVYEKSKGSTDTVKNNKADRSAIIAQMKADTESRMQQLTDLVKQTMQKQGNTLAKADDIWSYLASGDLGTVDEAAVKKAQEDISENGYWGVDKTSSRIVDFAIALSGNDPTQAEKMINAFKKGYDEATKTWGKELPDISSKTYDKVMEKFDQWKNGTYGDYEVE